MQPIVLLLPQSQLPAFLAAISSAVGRRPFTSVCTSFRRSALKFWMPAWSNGHILIVSSSLLTRVASCELILVSGFQSFPCLKEGESFVYFSNDILTSISFLRPSSTLADILGSGTKWSVREHWEGWVRMKRQRMWNYLVWQGRNQKCN